MTTIEDFAARDAKLFTNSEAQTWKRCRRKWWLTYYRRLVKDREFTAGPRAIGTRVHLGLETLYTTNYDVEAMFAAVKQAYEDDIPLAEDPEQLEKDNELVIIMLEGYVEWLEEEGSDATYEVVGAERTIAVPFETIRGTETALIGKLDLRVQDRDTGFRYFMDHKTVQDMGRIIKWAMLNEQFIHYNLLDMLEARAEGEEGRRTDGGVFNLLRKVKRTVRAKPPFYMRHPVRYNDDQLRAYYKRVWGELNDIIEASQALDAGGDPSVVAYPSPRWECSWDCDFFVACQLMDDGLSDAESVLDADFVTKDPLARYAVDIDDTDKETS